MNQDNSIAVGEWNTCPVGTIQQLSHHFSKRLRVSKRNQAIRRVSTAFTVLIVIAAGVWNMLPTDRPDTNHGGISCTDVQAALNLYTFGHLPAATNNQIAAHLRTCPACAAKLRQTQAGSAGDANMVSFHTQVAARPDFQSDASESSFDVFAVR